MYLQCREEDDDITPMDFLFEHLLNFEHIVNIVEGRDEEEHHPFKLVDASFSILVAIIESTLIHLSAHRHFCIPKIYALYRYKFHYNNFYSKVFRPPVV